MRLNLAVMLYCSVFAALLKGSQSKGSTIIVNAIGRKISWFNFWDLSLTAKICAHANFRLYSIISLLHSVCPLFTLYYESTTGRVTILVCFNGHGPLHLQLSWWRWLISSISSSPNPLSISEPLSGEMKEVVATLGSVAPPITPFLPTGNGLEGVGGMAAVVGCFGDPSGDFRLVKWSSTWSDWSWKV